MRVIEVARFGGPEVLKIAEAADPEPAPGEVVVTTSFADVLVLDAMIRSGRAGAWFGVQPPYVPGSGLAGRVTAVGEGADASLAGRPVIARTRRGGGPGGGYAGQAAVPAADVVPVPDGLSLADAAALLHDGATACALIAGTGVSAGETVLVIGAAGGLGILLVQYAAAAGGRVIAAARGTAKLDLALRMGAAAAVDYSDPDWVARTAAAGGRTGPQVVFDGVGGDLGEAAFAGMADGGRFSAHGAAAGGFARPDTGEAQRRGIAVRGIEQAQLEPGRHARRAAQALADAVADRIRPVIGQVFPLDRAADAHEAIESRAVTAKTLLEA